MQISTKFSYLITKYECASCTSLEDFPKNQQRRLLIRKFEILKPHLLARQFSVLKGGQMTPRYLIRDFVLQALLINLKLRLNKRALKG